MWQTLLDARKRVTEGKLDVDEIVLRKSISRELKEYKVEPPHVLVARKLHEQGLPVFVGMKIPYVIVGKAEGRQVPVHPDDFKGEYDARLYWNDLILPPLERVLDVMYPDTEWRALRLGKGPANQPAFSFTDVPVPRRVPKRNGGEPVKVKRQQVRISLPERGTHEAALAVRDVLDSRPGSVKVEIVVQTDEDEISIDIGKAWRCSLDGTQLIAELEAVPGVAVVLLS